MIVLSDLSEEERTAVLDLFVGKTVSILFTQYNKPRERHQGTLGKTTYGFELIQPDWNIHLFYFKEPLILFSDDKVRLAKSEKTILKMNNAVHEISGFFLEN